MVEQVQSNKMSKLSTLTRVLIKLRGFVDCLSFEWNSIKFKIEFIVLQLEIVSPDEFFCLIATGSVNKTRKVLQSYELQGIYK